MPDGGHVLGTKSIGNPEITYRLGERVKLPTLQAVDNFQFAQSTMAKVTS
jgi:hypothetical protein